MNRPTREQMEATRLAAGRDLASMSAPAVAAKYGVSRITAARWARRLGSGGIDALRQTNGAGRRSRLTAEQLAEVARMQSRPHTRLTGAALAVEIERKWGIRYESRYLYQMMNRLGIGHIRRSEAFVRAMGARHDR